MGNNQSKEVTSILLDIGKKCIFLKKKQFTKAKELIHHFVEKVLIPSFQKDKIFNEIYRGVEYTGSFFDGLRITNANEFDVNIVLEVPFPNYIIEDDIPGHAFIRVYNNPNHGFMKDDKIDGSLVLDWLKGLLYKTLHNEKYQFIWKGDFYSIGNSQSGPAMTLLVKSSDIVFDVDLVPVFKHINQTGVYLVPKHPLNRGSHIWRLSYPKRERNLLQGKKIAKQTIKFLKRVRDVTDMKILSSYYIKTVILHKLRQDSDSYSMKDLPTFLYESTELLIEYLEANFLPFYFDLSYNLFEKINISTCINISNRLKKMINGAKSNPRNLYKYLDANESLMMVQAQSLWPDVDVDVDSDEEFEAISHVQHQKISGERK